MRQVRTIGAGFILLGIVAAGCSSTSTNQGSGGTSTGGAAGSLGGGGAAGADATVTGGTGGLSGTGGQAGAAGTGGQPDAGGCSPGTHDCDGDAASCECPLPANAEPACNIGCGWKCKAGFVPFPTGKATSCASFSEVGNPDKCKYCETACECPTDYAPSEPFAIATAGTACPTGEGKLVFCQAPSAAPSLESDWGGAFLKTDTDCNTVTCGPKNSYTGNCSCPDGFDQIPLRVLVNRCGAGWVYKANLTLCYNKQAPLSTFGGAYQQVPNPEGGPPVCMVPNPKTGLCSCASGTTERTFQALHPDVANVESSISICWRP